MRSVIAIVVFAMAAFTFTATPAHAEDCNTVCASKPAGPQKNGCLFRCATAAKAEPTKTDEGDVSPTGLKAVAEAANAQPEEEVADTADTKTEPEDTSENGQMMVVVGIAAFVSIIMAITLLIICSHLRKRIDGDFNTLKHSIAQRPGYGEMKKFIQLFTELAELRSRLEYEKSNHDTQAISSHVAELRKGIQNVQVEKNKLSGVINSAESRLIEKRERASATTPNKFVIKAANAGDAEAKDIVQHHNSALTEMRKAEALLADLEAKMAPLDQREEQLGNMLEEASSEMNAIHRARSQLTHEIEMKEAEIESLTSSPPPLPLNNRR